MARQIFLGVVSVVLLVLLAARLATQQDNDSVAAPPRDERVAGEGEAVSAAASGRESLPAVPHLASRLAGEETGRWLSQWKAHLSRMNAVQLWALTGDPALEGQIEAKSLRDTLLRGCLVSSSLREFGEAQAGLVDDWCKALPPLGGTNFLREQASLLMHDADLLSATHYVVGPRKLRGSEAERREERELIEHVFRQASDPWTLSASTRALWSHQSRELLDDWTDVNALSGFQRDRLRLFVAADAACRATADCDAASVWLVELCAFSPGLQCASGSGMDALIAQNLSPLEARIVRAVSARVSKALAQR